MILKLVHEDSCCFEVSSIIIYSIKLDCGAELIHLISCLIGERTTQTHFLLQLVNLWLLTVFFRKSFIDWNTCKKKLFRITL